MRSTTVLRRSFAGVDADQDGTGYASRSLANLVDLIATTVRLRFIVTDSWSAMAATL